MIVASVSQIERGASLVHSAGSTMDNILTSSKRVTEIMADVVDESLAQSEKLDEVTRNITK